MVDPMYFKDRQGKRYEKPNGWGFSEIPVLEFLWGKPYNKETFRYIHSLRPGYIRVIVHNSEMTTDGNLWRVDIYLDANRVIEKITQEVEIGLVR